MLPSVIHKYNKPVPRYTSYPPANYFEPFGEADYLAAVDASNASRNNHLSFYLHIPFCRHLCHYCACNSYAMARGDGMQRYADALHREIDLVAARLDKSRRIAQIHYGGGSPTAMPASMLKALNEHLLSIAPVIERPELAIECHPGYLDAEGWAALADCGFNRFSLGVQDFNEEVLRTVNRRPSLLPMDEVFTILRSRGAGINLDFLYGLPHQSVASFSDTIKRAIALHPDRLVTFSYAHVPWVNRRQLILEKAGLPASEVKERMYDEAARLLKEAGYTQIGLDHFVLPDDELAVALSHNQLHRNFQGYCTRRTTGQVYAFGVTGISQLDGAYAQNGRDIETYISTLADGHLYTQRGYRLTKDQQTTREVIETLMCNYTLSWSELGQRLNLAPADVKAATAYDEAEMREMAADGLLTLTADGISVAPEGRPFVRSVAAALDPLMRHSDKKYSKPI